MMTDYVGHLSDPSGRTEDERMSGSGRGIGYLTRRKRTRLISGIDVTAFGVVTIVLLWLVVMFEFDCVRLMT